MKLIARDLTVEIIAENYGYNPKSADNARRYERFYEFGEHRPSSCHGIRVHEGDRELANAILMADGGASGVHERSAVIAGHSIFVAVGSYVTRLSLPALDLIFVTQADTVTCFGVYSLPGSTDILSHGELEIARLDDAGRILWSSSGGDIFSGDFTLGPKTVRVVDFEGTVYFFDLVTGRSQDAG
ncbi:hypothetical protein [Brevifollis gellanilyticus]|nr:hypothetical protein [Brevifollis gellanilyticus]